MLNEAKTSRPRPELRGRGRGWGRGQFPEVEAKVEAKNNYEKVPKNYDLRLLPEKFNKIPEFYMIFAQKCPTT